MTEEVPKNPPSPDFIRRYRSVLIEEDPTKLQARWAGASALVNAAKASDVEAMIRLVFDREDPDPAAIARFKTAFADVDPFFGSTENAQEVRVLAGAVLADLLRGRDDAEHQAALALTTAALDGARSTELDFDLVGMAEAALAKTAEEARVRPSKIQKTVAAASKKVDEALTAYATAQDEASALAAMKALSAQLNLVVTNTNSVVAGVVEAFETFQRVQDEELQLLWWLTNAWSESLDRPLAEVPEAARPLVVGAELADLTETYPGPASIDGLLLKSGVGADSALGVVDGVNACPLDWLKALTAPRARSPLTLPLHEAVARRLETGDPDSWVGAWSKVTGLAADVTLPPQALGRLFYRERLLVSLSQG